MAENVGAIKYTTEVDTSDTLTAEKQIDKATDKIVKDFEKIDKATKKNSNEIKKTTKAVDAALTTQTKAAERAARAAERTAERKAKTTERAAERSARAAEKAATAEKAFAEKSANDTARAAERAAVAKQKAAERSTRATVIANKRSAAAEQKRVSGFGRASGQAGIQIQQFVGQLQGGQNAMLALSQQSADFGFVLGAPLVGAIVGISATIAGFLLPELFKATEGMITNAEAADKLKGSFDELTKAQKEAATQVFQQKLDKDKKALESLRGDLLLTKIDLQAVGLSGETFISNLFGVGKEKATKKITDIKGSIVALELSIKETEKSISDLGAKGVKGTSKFKEASDALTLSLTSQIVALRDGEEAAFRFATAQGLGLKIGEQLPANIDKQITALFRLKKAKEKTKEEKTKRKSLISKAGDIGLTSEQRLMRGFEAEQNLLDEAVNKKLLTEESYLARKKELNDKYTKDIGKVRATEAKSAAASQQAMQGAVLGFISATTASLMSGMDEQSGAYKALFAIQKATQIAMTIANAETAATAAMAATPGPGGIAVSNLIRGLGYASAGIIAGTAIAGGREFGGPVNAGSAYRVGEAGPEIFTSGGKNFMIPGENGKVIANDDVGGGGFTQNVEIINNTPANVSTQTSDDGKQLKVFIGEVARQISENQGAIPRALKNGSNYQSKANR